MQAMYPTTYTATSATAGTNFFMAKSCCCWNQAIWQQAELLQQRN